MKFAFALACFVLCVYLSTTNAGVTLESCPENAKTQKECEDYVKEETKKNKYCRQGLVVGTDIQWLSCGIKKCEEGTHLGEEDLTKSFPDCCAECLPEPVIQYYLLKNHLDLDFSHA